jgi:hypothetical protein
MVPSRGKYFPFKAVHPYSSTMMMECIPLLDIGVRSNSCKWEEFVKRRWESESTLNNSSKMRSDDNFCHSLHD